MHQVSQIFFLMRQVSQLVWSVSTGLIPEVCSAANWATLEGVSLGGKGGLSVYYYVMSI